MSDQAGRWRVRLTRQAEKSLQRLPKMTLRRIDQAILSLTENPRPPESRVLAIEDDLYRLAIDDWRIIYAVEDEQLTILILEIAPKQQPERYQIEETSEEFLLETFSQREGAAWYVLYTRSGYESEMRNNLLHRVEAMGMQDKIFQVVVVTQPVLPSLVLVEMILDDDSWYVIRNTPGVTGWLGAEGKPRPIAPDDIEEIAEAKGRETKILETLRNQFSERVSDEIAAYFKRANRPKIRVLIASGLSDERETLRKLLFFEAGIDIVGVTNDETVVEKAVELAPDVILLDISKRSPDNLDICERLYQQLPSTGIIVMSIFGDAEFFRQAMLAGAKQFLVKPFSSDELREAIRRVGGASLSPTGKSDFEALGLRRRGGSLLKRIEQQGKGEAGEPDSDINKTEAAARWLKWNKLGAYVEITLSVSDLSISLAFYEKLGLEQVDGNEKPYPWAIVSDGALGLGLHQQVFSSPTITYFTSNVSDPIHYLKMLDIECDLQASNKSGAAAIIHYLKMLDIFENDLIASVEFTAYEGQRVALNNKFVRQTEAAPKRKFLARYDRLVELSLPTVDIAAAVAYWQQLGFERIAGSDKPYPWVVVSDSLIRLGFHQTRKFTKPSLTYFAPDMPARLDCLQKKGIEFLSEHRDVQGGRAGAVIESPDGQRLFLFAGEIR